MRSIWAKTNLVLFKWSKNSFANSLRSVLLLLSSVFMHINFLPILFSLKMSTVALRNIDLPFSFYLSYAIVLLLFFQGSIRTPNICIKPITNIPTQFSYDLMGTNSHLTPSDSIVLAVSKAIPRFHLPVVHLGIIKIGILIPILQIS